MDDLAHDSPPPLAPATRREPSERFQIEALLLILSFLVASIVPGVLAEASGIAQRYVADRGIDKDPEVVFAENFESESVSDIIKRWTHHRNVAGISLSRDVPVRSGGMRSLQMTALGGMNTGGHLYKRLPVGFEKLYLRYYIKYAAKGSYHHTGGYLGGYHPPRDSPQGAAGYQPRGDDRFSVGAEPVTSSLRFDLYTYWMGMRGDPNGEFWGNDFVQDAQLTAPRGRWMCVEVMLKLNSPVSSRNGELALWIDGRPVIHLGEGFPLGEWIVDSFHRTPRGQPFEGFQWRNTDQLQINWMMLLHYVTRNPLGFVGTVWFDDVVVATSYVGPINASGKVGRH